MHPAHERFAAGDAAGFRVHDRLIEQPELFTLDCTAKIHFDRAPLDGVALHRFIEK